MKYIMPRTLKIILLGTEVSILLFLISLYFCYVQTDLTAANSFALYGVKMLMLFIYIAVADCLAKQILDKRRERDE